MVNYGLYGDDGEAKKLAIINDEGKAQALLKLLDLTIGLRRVAQALAASADTLAMLDAEAADAARLKQSILKSAFEGRLVPQDPTDEPAGTALARLRATHSTAAPSRRGRKKRA